MYKELEGTYNNNKLTGMENDLVAKKKHLYDLYQDTQASVKVKTEQSKLITKAEGNDDKNKQTIGEQNARLREAKTQMKLAKDEQRRLLKDVKEKHTLMLHLQEKVVRLEQVIKEQEDKGFSPRSVKTKSEMEKESLTNTVFRMIN